MPAKVQVSHHIRALPPALKTMQAMGYSAGECLAGTGIEPGDLLAANAAPDFTLAQEFRFHRNLLRLSGDPLLGLKLGQAYSLQTYGLFGYAFLSAPTLRQALNIVSNYGALSFTLFRIAFRESATAGIVQFSRLVDIPADLFTFYVDRDVSAALAGADPDHIAPVKPIGISLMHCGEGRQQTYRNFFDCPVTFDAPRSEIRLDASILDTAMPLRDADTSAVCQQQCQLLLARMSRSSGFIEQVRQLIVARPGYFPDIDYIARKLCMTSRTLRRRLTEEGSSYQQILGDVRYQLAREYLATSRLPVEEIAAMLGYSNPGNFTHAFKRWHGSPPRQYRQEHR
jgi:AraC-like DNA-binding protein